jgi:hypothetical protein
MPFSVTMEESESHTEGAVPGTVRRLTDLPNRSVSTARGRVLLDVMPRRRDQLIKDGGVERGGVREHIPRHHLLGAQHPDEEPARCRCVPSGRQHHVDDRGLDSNSHSRSGHAGLSVSINSSAVRIQSSCSSPAHHLKADWLICESTALHKTEHVAVTAKSYRQPVPGMVAGRIGAQALRDHDGGEWHTRCRRCTRNPAAPQRCGG